MADIMKVGPYFKSRYEVKRLMRQMLGHKERWTRELKREFEKAWNEYCQAYDEHEALHKERKAG